jgi:hypothetical protein
VPGGDRVHAVIASVVGNLHRPESPQRWDLLGIEPGRAVQAGHENDGKRLGHSAVLSFGLDGKNQVLIQLIAVQQD